MQPTMKRDDPQPQPQRGQTQTQTRTQLGQTQKQTQTRRGRRDGSERRGSTMTGTSLRSTVR